MSGNELSAPAIGLSILLLSSHLSGQPPEAPSAETPPSEGGISLEDIYSPDPERRIDFVASPPKIEWLSDGKYLLWPRRTDGDQQLQVVDARSGKARPFYDPDRMAEALSKLPGVSGEQAQRLARGSLHLSPSKTAVLLNFANDLFFYELGSDRARRLTNDPEPEVGEEFSPDGRMVSFVRDYDLHVVEVLGRGERALTAGGSPELFFGRLDWVYQEELYGRGNFKGYWWSPDSRFIAYLRLDESPVREFVVVDHLPVELETEVTNYPKAGSPNPEVALGVVPVAGGATRWIDLARYEPIQHLIVRVGWSPSSSRVLLQVQDREQTWLDLLSADPISGESRLLLHETTPAWVEVNGEPHWLEDGTFLWFSERTGFRHLYHYSAEGELLRQITDGAWEVRELHGVDEERGRIYYSGTEASPIGLQVYRVDLDGSGRTRISSAAGTHEAQFDPDLELYVDRWSDLRTPPQVRLHARNGSPLRTIFDDPIPELENYALGEVELLQVPASDGFLMEAMLIRPPDFDPDRVYPVLQYTYGGPHSPRVRNRWGGPLYMWHQMLAQRGYVIWICDNRSASGKGMAPAWEAYQRLGEVELRDIEDGIAWLSKKPWVDSERIGIWGWSYGGFMTAFALTRSDLFSIGIAGAPVTDWRLYDSIYTERYMRMPQNNPDGYERTAITKRAADLSGRLLLLHGTTDDNVHLQNTIQFVYELQKAGKEFQLMLYPRSRHSVHDRDLIYHLRRLMTDFVTSNL